MKPFEEQMMKAHTTGWVRMTKQQLEVYAPLYEQASGKPFTQSQRNCPRCVINALRDGWTLYKKYKDSPAGRKVDKELENGESEGRTT